jgi:hypothetical protein
VAGAAQKGRIEVAGASGEFSATPVALAVSATSETFEYRLGIEEIGGAAVEEVELSVTPLVDDRGAQHVVSWGLEGGAIDTRGRKSVVKPVAPSTQYTVVLRASLPELGTYKATLTPFWNGGPHQKIALTVTRARPALNLEVRDPDPIAQTGDLETVTFKVVLQATEDRGVRLKAPVLRSFVEIRGADAGAKRFYASGALTVKDDKTGKPIEGDDDLALGPRESKSLRFELKGLSGPGHYEATVRFASADAPPVDKTVAIFLREGALWAVLLIGLGVALSWVLRWFVMNERPRVANQQVVLGLISDLKECLELPGVDEDGRGLVAAVRRDLRALLSEFLVKVDARDQQRLEALGLKVQLVHKCLVLRPSVLAIASPGVRNEYLNTLDTIAAVLRLADATCAKLASCDTDLIGLPDQIRASVAKDLEQREEALRKDLETAITQLSPGRLLTDLATIKAELEASLGARSFEALVRAQTGLVRALADDLLRRLDRRPGFVDQATWPEAANLVRRLLEPARTAEPARAREIYRVAYATYLRRLNEAAKQILDRATKAGGDQKVLTPLDNLHKNIVAALDGGQLEQADNQIFALGKELLAAFGSGGDQMGPPGQPPADVPLAPSGLVVPEILPASPSDLPRLAKTEAIAAARIHRAWYFEALINVAVLVAALGLGIKLLYVDDLTWGGWSGYLTAGLWGVGLHQFTYSGIGGLVDRVTGRGAGAGTGVS